MTFLQELWVDYAKREMHVLNTNVTYAGYLMLKDEVYYRADPTNPEWTAYQVQAWMQLPNFPFRQQVEAYMVRSYERNTGKGRAVDLEFVAEVLHDGWIDPRTTRALSPATAAAEADAATIEASVAATAVVTALSAGAGSGVHTPASSINGADADAAGTSGGPTDAGAGGAEKPAPGAPVPARRRMQGWLAWVSLGVGLVAVGGSPYLLQRLGLTSMSPSITSVLTTMLSVGWVVVHMQLFPRLWQARGDGNDGRARADSKKAALPPPPGARLASSAAAGADGDGNIFVEEDATNAPTVPVGDVPPPMTPVRSDAAADAPRVRTASNAVPNDAVSRPHSLSTSSGASAASGASLQTASLTPAHRICISRDRAVQEVEVGTAFTLADCDRVTVPAWIDRYRNGAFQTVYLVDVRLRSGAAWTVEKTTDDFDALRVAAAIPGTVWALPDLPAVRGTSSTDYGMYLIKAERRRRLDQYLQGTATSPARCLAASMTHHTGWGAAGSLIPAREPVLVNPNGSMCRVSAEDKVVAFLRSHAPILLQAPTADLLAGPLDGVFRRQSTALQPVILAHWRLRWCDGMLALEDNALVVARGEPIGKVRQHAMCGWPQAPSAHFRAFWSVCGLAGGLFQPVVRSVPLADISNVVLPTASVFGGYPVGVIEAARQSFYVYQDRNEDELWQWLEVGTFKFWMLPGLGVRCDAHGDRKDWRELTCDSRVRQALKAAAEAARAALPASPPPLQITLNEQVWSCAFF